MFSEFMMIKYFGNMNKGGKREEYVNLTKIKVKQGQESTHTKV